MTSGAPTEAANDALLINEIADGRDILFWTQDDPAVFVSVSPLRSEWRGRPPHSHWGGDPMIGPWGSGSRQTLHQNR